MLTIVNLFRSTTAQAPLPNISNHRCRLFVDGCNPRSRPPSLFTSARQAVESVCAAEVQFLRDGIISGGAGVNVYQKGVSLTFHFFFSRIAAFARTLFNYLFNVTCRWAQTCARERSYTRYSYAKQFTLELVCACERASLTSAATATSADQTKVTFTRPYSQYAVLSH